MRLEQDDAKALGSVLRRRRESANMSRAALGRIIARDPASIQAYEQGGKKVYGTWIVATPPDNVLESIAAALGTTRDAICTEAGLGDDADALAEAAMAASAAAVRAINANVSGVTITGRAEDVSALLGLALERGLLGRLTFTPVHAR